MRLRMVLVVCAALALTVGAATATAGGGNSANAKACQKGGWQSLHPSGGGVFKNEGDCVSYLARGGTLVGDSRHDCESVGGTFSTDQNTSFIVLNPGSVLWTCNGIPLANGGYNTGIGLADCRSDGALRGGATLLFYAFGPVWDTTCADASA
jgi:hypothetical protein